MKDYLRFVLLPMLVSGSGTTELDCFKEALPYLFGSDVGETHFTAITDDLHGNTADSSNSHALYIGGDTTNSLLMTWPTEYVMADKRPFVMMYILETNSMLTTTTDSIDKFVWFNNNDFREVLAMHYVRDSSSYGYHNIHVLIESNIDELYLF